MSEKRQPPPPTSIDKSRKKKQKGPPPWMLGKQSEPRSPAATVGGVSDAFLIEDVIPGSKDSNRPSRPVTSVTRLVRPSARGTTIKPSSIGTSQPRPSPQVPVRPPPPPLPPTTTQSRPSFPCRSSATTSSPSPSSHLGATPSPSTTPSPLSSTPATSSPSPPTFGVASHSTETSSLRSAPSQNLNTRNNSTNRQDDRLLVSVYRNTLQPSGAVKGIMRLCFQLQTDSKGHTFQKVPREALTFYWREFQKRCRWAQSDDGLIKSL